MKINFNAVLTDLKGNPLKAPDIDMEKIGEFLRAGDVKAALAVLNQSKDLTLDDVASTALLTNFRDEVETQDGPQKKKLFLLACRCTGVANLELEEVVTLKKRIGKACPTLIVGRAYELIEPEITLP